MAFLYESHHQSIDSLYQKNAIFTTDNASVSRLYVSAFWKHPTVWYLEYFSFRSGTLHDLKKIPGSCFSFQVELYTYIYVPLSFM